LPKIIFINKTTSVIPTKDSKNSSSNSARWRTN
jgi:hypothetical protein